MVGSGTQGGRSRTAESWHLNHALETVNCKRGKALTQSLLCGDELLERLLPNSDSTDNWGAGVGVMPETMGKFSLRAPCFVVEYSHVELLKFPSLSP